MGVRDRDWYQDHLRRATYAPKEFRRGTGRGIDDPPPRPSSGKSLVNMAGTWLLVLGVGTAGAMAVLNHHQVAPPLRDSRIPPGVPTAALRIVSASTSTAVAVELVALGPNATPTGVVWTFLVRPGQSRDQDVPEGVYRVRVVHHRFAVPDARIELPTVMEFKNSATQRAGGTLTI